eukprot:COSAG02_NODE_6704_length_3411_cov_1.610507_1_plen_72_part_10
MHKDFIWSRYTDPVPKKSLEMEWIPTGCPLSSTVLYCTVLYTVEEEAAAARAARAEALHETKDAAAKAAEEA